MFRLPNAPYFLRGLCRPEYYNFVQIDLDVESIFITPAYRSERDILLHSYSLIRVQRCRTDGIGICYRKIISVAVRVGLSRIQGPARLSESSQISPSSLIFVDILGAERYVPFRFGDIYIRSQHSRQRRCRERQIIEIPAVNRQASRLYLLCSQRREERSLPPRGSLLSRVLGMRCSFRLPYSDARREQ